MVLPVVKYGTPVLRQKGAPVETITPTIKKLIAEIAAAPPARPQRTASAE